MRLFSFPFPYLLLDDGLLWNSKWWHDLSSWRIWHEWDQRSSWEVRIVRICHTQVRVGCLNHTEFALTPPLDTPKISSFCSSYHSRNLSRNNALSRAHSHLLHEGILECQMIPTINEKLILQVEWWMKVLARRLLPVTATLFKSNKNPIHQNNNPSFFIQ